MKVKRSKSKKPARTYNSELARRLEAGEPIAGLKGYICIEDNGDSGDYNGVDAAQPVYIAVRCLGVSVEGCGVSIKVEVISGRGEMEITPCRFIDTLADVVAKSELYARCKEASSVFEYIKQPQLMVHRRRRLQEYLDTLPKETVAGFLADIKEEYNMPINRLAKTELGIATRSLLERVFALEDSTNSLGYW